jgi:hypothetical protein
MKIKIMLLFFFFPILSNANEIEMMFECEFNEISYDFYQTERICHFIPLKNEPIIILNESTNTEVNQEILFALTENHYIKKGFNTEALIDEEFGYVKLNKKDIELFTEIFGDSTIAKKFITYHELGHIYFNNKSEYTLKREMFSDLFALKMLDKENFDVNKIKIRLMDYRKREAVKKKSLTHFTTFFLEEYKVSNPRCVSNELPCIVNESKEWVASFSKKEVFKERLVSNIERSEEEWYHDYLFLTGYIYNKKFPYHLSKENLIKEFENFPEITLEKLLKDKKLKEYYLRMLSYEIDYSRRVSKEDIQ